MYITRTWWRGLKRQRPSRRKRFTSLLPKVLPQSTIDPLVALGVHADLHLGVVEEGTEGNIAFALHDVDIVGLRRGQSRTREGRAANARREEAIAMAAPRTVSVMFGIPVNARKVDW